MRKSNGLVVTKGLRYLVPKRQEYLINNILEQLNFSTGSEDKKLVDGIDGKPEKQLNL